MQHPQHSTPLTRRLVLRAAGLGLVAAAFGRSAAAQPAPLKISGIAARRDRLGALWFCGLVENAGRNPVLDSAVTVGLQNGAGATLTEITGTTLNRVVPPGGSTPFAVLVSTVPDDWKREGYAVDSPPPDADVLATAVNADLKLSGAKLVDGSWGPQIVGDIRNASSSAVTGVQVAAAVYRRDGRVEYATVGYLTSETLAAGATYPVAVDLLGLAKDFKVDKFDLYPEGWRVVG